MGYAFSFSELASDLGTSTADGLRNVANTAANAVCDLYQNYTDFTTGWSDPTGIGAFNNALFSRLCTPRAKNPASPPSVPFTGGQCDGTYYTVQGTYSHKTSGGTQNFTLFNVPGPLSGLNIGAESGTQYGYGIGCKAVAPFLKGRANIVIGTPSNIDPFKMQITSATPTSGPNNCGNPPPSWPYASPAANNYNYNTNVNIGAGVVVNANVVISPIFFKANAYIQPQIQVQVGPFNVTFDAGGVSIEPSFNFSTDKTLPDTSKYPTDTLPPANQNPGNQPAGQQVTPCDLTSVNTKLTTLQTTANAIKDCACPITYAPSTSSLGAGISGYAALPSNCIKVNLTLTQRPDNAKVQKSNGSEPDLYFCGYFYWGDGTGRSERIPLNTTQNVLFPPPWATAFGWNLYTGYNCSVTATSLSPSKTGGKLTPLLMYNGPA